jgi:hypothetical protein
MHNKAYPYRLAPRCQGLTLGGTPTTPQTSILIEAEGFNKDRWKGLEKSTLQLKNPYSTKYICVKHFPPLITDNG